MGKRKQISQSSSSEESSDDEKSETLESQGGLSLYNNIFANGSELLQNLQFSPEEEFKNTGESEFGAGVSMNFKDISEIDGDERYYMKSESNTSTIRRKKTSYEGGKSVEEKKDTSIEIKSSNSKSNRVTSIKKSYKQCCNDNRINSEQVPKSKFPIKPISEASDSADEYEKEDSSEASVRLQ